MVNIRNIFIGLGVLLFALVVGYGSVQVDRHFRGSATHSSVPDTVTKEVKVPEIVRDTVPKTVVRYKTIRDTVVKRIPVPSDMTIRGVLPENYFELDRTSASVTYFDPNALEYRKEVFDIHPLSNTVSLGVGGFGTARSATLFPYVRYETGRLDVRVGYGPSIDASGYSLTPTVQVNFDLLRYRWR